MDVVLPVVIPSGSSIASSAFPWRYQIVASNTQHVWAFASPTHILPPVFLNNHKADLLL